MGSDVEHDLKRGYKTKPGNVSVYRQIRPPMQVGVALAIVLFRSAGSTYDGGMIWARSFIVLSSIACAAAQGPPSQSPQEVVFPSGSLQLHGFLWKPDGAGPFAAIVWNHGSERVPGSQPELAKFYINHADVFFVPHRRGQGRSPGPYIQDLVQQAPLFQRGRRMMELQDEEVADVLAALRFLRSQNFVDGARIAISGCSYGGIQTLLAGERGLAVKALVPFAPGAMAWDRNDAVGDRLSDAVAREKAPVFLLQAKNDYSLGPSHVLSKVALKKGADFQSKIYPAFGRTTQDGHWGFCTTGMDVWGNDVLAFLAARMK